MTKTSGGKMKATGMNPQFISRPEQHDYVGVGRSLRSQEDGTIGECDYRGQAARASVLRQRALQVPPADGQGRRQA